MAPLLLLLPLRPIILTPYLPTYLKLWWLECAIKGIDSLFQFTSWVDAVIFVFSLENEASFNAIYNYYAKMCQYRNMQEIPLILVGTQDAISENQPRVIDDSRARKLANDLKRCAYYETCATYGLNVERVFQDGK